MACDLRPRGNGFRALAARAGEGAVGASLGKAVLTGSGMAPGHVAGVTEVMLVALVRGAV